MRGVEWTMRRHGERVRVWACKRGEEWTFRDKEVGDVCWSRLTATSELIAEAELRLTAEAMGARGTVDRGLQTGA